MTQCNPVHCLVGVFSEANAKRAPGLVISQVLCAIWVMNLKSFEMPQVSTSSNRKKVVSPVTTTEEFPSCLYRQRKLFNLRRLRAIRKVSSWLFLIADDCAVCTQQWRQASAPKKTKVMFQPAPGNRSHEPQIWVNRQTPQEVQTLTYLGSTLSCNATIDARLKNRISKAEAEERVPPVNQAESLRSSRRLCGRRSVKS